MKPEWKLKSPDPEMVKTLIKDLSCHPVIAAILANRSIFSKQDARAFFTPSLSKIRHPFGLKDMQKAVERIVFAIKERQTILIFGDYDADGITSTVILWEFLDSLGAEVSFYVPHRVKEGYGPKPNHISQIAKPKNVALMITVDCGSDSHDAVHCANQCGIDVVITDHHKISPQMPDALAVVNPKRQDCPSGLDHLAGVGVVFYLLMGLRKILREKGFFKEHPEPNLRQYCDMVALGTVADIMPMIHENRVFTRIGMDIMGGGKRTGLKTLMDSVNLTSGHINTEDIAFRLAPRLNAAGRIGHAETSINLLTEKKLQKAAILAERLNQYNTQRQILEKEMFENILMAIKRDPDLMKPKSLILYDNNWHEGLLGIVASRLVKKFTKPVVLLSTHNGLGKGSARSIPGFDLYEGLKRCSGFLEGFGGHAMAAGLSIKTQSLPDFIFQFESAVGDLTSPDAFTPCILIDQELPFKLITDKLLTELELLHPFGIQNPEPLFMSPKIKVVQSHIISRRHRRMVLRQEEDFSNAVFSAIQFNIDPKAPKPAYFDQILYRLKYNRWKGKKSIQLVIEDTSG